ncbi:sensor histidine kinase [Streptomyces himalayensis]|uniref:histidine kinase n=1 Tax=Streptomyces himalayensis subsp. himalayensis TaxID=2756131 RepID=A0A7W0DGY9_9ACTN|nr:nitrate- and nitrite sensing domain-containing protein [Streptomyces himalayensis]MBA2944503.1 nitrate- and nitrite sensing domain-containing protein [Streptomyces himalayensis subsp. himalayensis]
MTGNTSHHRQMPAGRTTTARLLRLAPSLAGAEKGPGVGSPSGARSGSGAGPGRRLRQLPGWRSIRGRVAVVLAVPTCLLLSLTGLGVADRAADWSAARDTVDQVGLLVRAQDLVRELQRERGLTNGLLGGAGKYRDDVDVQRARTDDVLTEVEAVLHEQSGDRPSAATTALEDALTPLDSLGITRDEVDAGSADRTRTLAFYTEAVTALIGAQSTRMPAGDHRITDGIQALQALARATEAVALERGSLNGVFAAGRFRAGEYLAFTEIRATRLAALDQYAGLATPAQESELDAAFDTAAARRATAYEKRAEGGADGSTLSVDPSVWWSTMTTLVDDLHGVQRKVGEDVRAHAADAGSTATQQLGGFLALGALILAVATALAVLAARSITRPLSALADQADAVARSRLPAAVRRIQEAGPDDTGDLDEPVAPEPKEGGDEAPGSAREITRLAAALRNVERTAVGLAGEQAVLRRNTTESLASLGRRNQALLGRQLGLITTLESQELDPDALAELFELDHLATRMRRNAESLLVLAGAETPPRSWPGTVTMTEVVQSAVAEVEQYQRVQVPDLEQSRVRGHAVAEVSHLLAELVENALVFSPPAQPVEIYGWRDTGEYCLAIVDHGIGMSDEQLARANARLSGRESFLITPAGSAARAGGTLGHYVVGRLAARLGAQVELRRSQGPGTTAYVALPAAIVQRPDQQPAASAPAPG